MKVAVGTLDGINVSEHLARSSRFIVYETDCTPASRSEERLRGTDECGNHSTFTDILAGCKVVLCGGVGQGAVNALASSGIETVVLSRPYRIDEAVAAYLAGSLETTDARVCLCGPAH